MESSEIILFAVASLAFIAAPGPDMIYVLTRGVSEGKSVGLLSAVGITVGILVHTFFAAIGLAALFETSPVTFMIIKYAGGAYLLFLGVKTIASASNISTEGDAKDKK